MEDWDRVVVVESIDDSSSLWDGGWENSRARERRNNCGSIDLRLSTT